MIDMDIQGINTSRKNIVVVVTKMRKANYPATCAHLLNQLAPEVVTAVGKSGKKIKLIYMTSLPQIISKHRYANFIYLCHHKIKDYCSQWVSVSIISLQLNADKTSGIVYGPKNSRVEITWLDCFLNQLKKNCQNKVFSIKKRTIKTWCAVFNVFCFFQHLRPFTWK